MKASLLFLTFLLASFACKKNEYKSPYLKCKVASIVDINCGKPVLDFSEDSVAIRKFMGTSIIGYSAIGLPQTLNIQNKLLYVTVRETRSEELNVCTTFGPSFQGLTVVDAKAR